jgi:hypothetical protein
MALFDHETDPIKERDGVRIVFPQWEYVRLKLARAGGARLALEVERATKPLRGEVGPIADAARAKAVNAAFVRAVILEWDTLMKTMKTPPGGVTPDADGYVCRRIDMRDTLVDDTPENMITVFETPGFDVFLEDVLAKARKADNYLLHARKLEAGN